MGKKITRNEFYSLCTFIENADKLFYDKYDEFNLLLSNLRNKEQSGKIQSITLGIDNEKGLSNQLNEIIVLSSQRLSKNLFEKFVQPKIHSSDIAYPYEKAPIEADGVVFMRNPVFAFEVIYQFFRLRNTFPLRKWQYHMYINNRIARWFYRYSHFMLEYNNFDHNIQEFLLDQEMMVKKADLIAIVLSAINRDLSNLAEARMPVALVWDLKRFYLVMLHALWRLIQHNKMPPDSLVKVMQSISEMVSFDDMSKVTSGENNHFVNYHIFSEKNKFDTMLLLINMNKDQLHKAFLLLPAFQQTDIKKIFASLQRKNQNLLVKIFYFLAEQYYNNKKLDHGQKKILSLLKKFLHPAELYIFIEQEPEFKDKIVANISLLNKEWSNSVLKKKSLDEESESVDNTKINSIGEHKSLLFSKLMQQEQLSKLDIIELGRIPFLFAHMAYGKKQFSPFNLAELAVIRMQPLELVGMIRHCIHTRQLNQKQGMFLIKFLTQIAKIFSELVAQRIKSPIKTSFLKEDNSINFVALNEKLTNFGNKLSKEFPSIMSELANFELLLQLLGEIRHSIAVQENISKEKVSHPQLLELIHTKGRGIEILRKFNIEGLGLENWKNIYLKDTAEFFLQHNLSYLLTTQFFLA